MSRVFRIVVEAREDVRETLDVRAECRRAAAQEEAERAVQERVVAAAVIYNGLIFSIPSPARHGDVLYKLAESTPNLHTVLGGLHQGFTTSAGRYVSRREAYVIAKQARQLLDGVGRPPDLFSEDVW